MLLFLLLLPFQACSYLHNPADIEYWESMAEANLLRKLKQNTEGKASFPKNVIFFLGDGMGISAVTVARIQKSMRSQGSYNGQPLGFETFENAALVRTHSYDAYVTDSAAGAMALFGGRKTASFDVGRLPTHRNDCSTFETSFINDGIAELAVNKGLAVGFATTTRVTHATPAAMFAKGIDRFAESDADITKSIKEYDRIEQKQCYGRDIASQLLSHPANKFKVLFGGGKDKMLPKTEGGERDDNRNILKEWKEDSRKKLVFTEKEMNDLQLKRDEGVLGLFSEDHLPYYLEEKLGKKKTAPRLVDLTRKAIEIMEKDNENGYFLMIEGGRIDHAEHENQMNVAVEELWEFDEAIMLARNMTNCADTLLIVTADHSHALALPGYLKKKEGSIMDNMHNFDQDESDPANTPQVMFATGPGQKTALNYTKEQAKDPHFISPAYVYMKKGTHGGDDVGLWADGPYSRIFSGSLENTEVAYYIKYLLNLVENNKMNESRVNRDLREDKEKAGLKGWLSGVTVNDLVVICGVCILVTVFCTVISSVSLVFVFLHGRRNLISSKDSETALVR